MFKVNYVQTRRALASLVFMALALAGAPAKAAPPDVPPALPVKVGSLVVFEVKPYVEAGVAKPFSFAAGFDKSKCPIMRLYSEPGEPSQFAALPQVSGEFYLTFWTRGEKETGHAQLVLTATGDGGVVPPPKKPIDPLPPPPTAALYFVLVRPDGPTAPAFTQAMQWPEWKVLTTAGHTYKDKTVTDAQKLGVRIPAGSPLPVVVVLRTRADGKSSEQLGVMAFPASGAEVLKLPAAFTAPTANK